MFDRIKALSIELRAALGTVVAYICVKFADQVVEKLFEEPVTRTSKSIEEAAEKGVSTVKGPDSQFADLYLFLKPAVDFLLGPFGWGFCLAGLLYTLSDWPKINHWLRFRRRNKQEKRSLAEFHRNRDAVADEALADQCQSLASRLVHADSNNKVRKGKNFWRACQDQNDSAWTKAIESDARSAAKTNKELGVAYLEILAQLNMRNIYVERLGAELSMYNYGSIAALLVEISESLKSGGYHEKIFKPAFNSPLGN